MIKPHTARGLQCGAVLLDSMLLNVGYSSILLHDSSDDANVF